MRRCEVMGCEEDAVVKISVVRMDESSAWNGWACDKHADDSARAAMHWCLPESELGREWDGIRRAVIEGRA